MITAFFVKHDKWCASKGVNRMKTHYENIDAAIFSGDLLYDEERRKELKEYCERWQKAIKEHEAISAETVD